MTSSDHLSCGKYPLNCHFESFIPRVNLFRDFIIRTGNIWNVNRWNLQAFKGDFVQTTFIFIDSFFNNFLSLDVIVFKIFVISKLSSAGEILNSMTSSAISSFKLSTTFSGASLSVPISSGISSLSEVSGRFAYGSFRLRSVRLRIESIRLRLICQFAYELTETSEV